MSATAEGYTVVRVKRKKEDDPDKGLKVDLKRVSSLFRRF